MDNDTTVPQEATTSDEELDLELNLDDTEDVEALKANLEKERKAKEQILARAKKAEALLKGEKPPRQLPKTNEEIEATKDRLTKLEQIEAKRQFGYEHDLSPDEVDRVFAINPNPTKDILEDDFVKAGLQAIRAKKRVASNTPGSTNTAVRFAPEKPLSEMSPDEKQTQFEAYMEAKRGSNLN